MWASLSSWIVGDGEIPYVARGEVLPRDVGLAGLVWELRPPAAVDGEVALKGPDPAGFETVHSLVTGTVSWVGDAEPVEAVLAFGAVRILLRGHGLSLETVAVGARLTAHASLVVLGSYEWDDFPVPDLRRWWTCRGLREEWRSVVRSEVVGMTAGPVIQVRDVEAVSDEHPRACESPIPRPTAAHEPHLGNAALIGARPYLPSRILTYLVDLEPVRDFR